MKDKLRNSGCHENLSLEILGHAKCTVQNLWSSMPFQCRNLVYLVECAVLLSHPHTRERRRREVIVEPRGAAFACTDT
jgi:hypothetical protein